MLATAYTLVNVLKRLCRDKDLTIQATTTDIGFTLTASKKDFSFELAIPENKLVMTERTEAIYLMDNFVAPVRDRLEGRV